MKSVRCAIAAIAAVGLGLSASAATIVIPESVMTQTELAEYIASAEAGSIIRLPSGPIQFSRPDTSADNAIVIDKSLTLEGPASGCQFVGVTDESKGASFIKTEAETSVVLKNIIFRDTFSPNNSTLAVSPVRAEGALEVENCQFRNMLQKAGGGVGGALRTMADATLRDCVFDGCAIIMGNTVYGGAWYAGGGSVSAVSTVFTNCFCSSGGGAVYLAGTVTGARFEKVKFLDICCGNGGAQGGAIRDAMASTSSGLEVVDCVFRNCLAKQGGVLHATDEGGAHKILFERCEITDCYANGWGGAVRCNRGNPLAFLFTTFTGVGGNQWGAVMDVRCQLYMVNCTMTGGFNIANTSRAGGGVNTFSGASILNSVLAYNYHDLGANNIDVAVYGGTTKLINSIANSPQSPKYESGSTTYTLATDLESLGSATDLFAEYETISIYSLPENYWHKTYLSVSGPVHELNQTVVVPVVKKPLKRVDSLAVLPSETGILKDKGFPVKADAARTYVAWSEDDGATWKTLYGTDPNDGTVEIISRDQLGQTFDKAPIGAVVIPKKPGLIFIVR